MGLELSVQQISSVRSVLAAVQCGFGLRCCLKIDTVETEEGDVNKI